MTEAERQIVEQISDELKFTKTCTKFYELVSGNGEIVPGIDAKDMGKMLGYAKASYKSIKVFDSFIDDLKLSVGKKMLVALLVSNYDDNANYLDECIRLAKQNGNKEMTQIYVQAKTELYDAYVQFITNAEKYLQDQFSGDVSFASIVDIIDADLGLLDVCLLYTSRCV